MVSIYDFSSYQEYLGAWIRSQPRAGRGVKGQIAQRLKISPTLVSFLLSGKKSLTLEQASDLADFIGLNEFETDFLFLLVEHHRAGHFRLKHKLERKIQLSQEQSRRFSKRLKKDAELPDHLKAVYYSSWIYTALRNLVALRTDYDAATLAKRLHVPLPMVNKALSFLLENDLCREENGQLIVGPTYTHVDADSPYVNKHRQNWRIRGFTMMEQKNESDLFYTSPMSLSRADAENVRKLLLRTVQEVVEVMRPSPSEEVHCLNIDWFEY